MHSTSIGVSLKGIEVTQEHEHIHSTGYIHAMCTPLHNLYTYIYVAIHAASVKGYFSNMTTRLLLRQKILFINGLLTVGFM